MRSLRQGLIPVLATLAMLSLVFAAIRIYGADSARLLPDMRQLEPYVGRNGVKQGPLVDWFAQYQSAQAVGKRPFHTALRLDTPIEKDDRFYLEGTFAVDDGNTCLMTWVARNTGAAESVVRGIEFTIAANGVRRTLPLGEIASRSSITLEGITPVNGEVTVQFEIRANESKSEFPHELSRVSVDYLYFWGC